MNALTISKLHDGSSSLYRRMGAILTDYGLVIGGQLPEKPASILGLSGCLRIGEVVLELGYQQRRPSLVHALFVGATVLESQGPISPDPRHLNAVVTDELIIRALAILSIPTSQKMAVPNHMGRLVTVELLSGLKYLDGREWSPAGAAALLDAHYQEILS